MEKSAEHEAVKEKQETETWKILVQLLSSPWTHPAQNPHFSVLMLCLVRNSWKCVVDVYEKTEVIFAIEQMANAFLSQFSICYATF